jgi:Holliday junction DNA helicase RuvA
VLELQDKATKYAISTSLDLTGSSAGTGADVHQDALSALVNLGYKEILAKRALQSLKLTPGTALEDTLKAALQILLK